MKKCILFLFLLTSIAYSVGAQVKISDSLVDENVNPWAVLELESHSKGLILPRLTSAEIQAISNPPAGLVVYNTDLKSMQVNTSTSAPQWTKVVTMDGTDNTGALIVPVGTTAQRPASPVAGMLRYNTNINQFEIYKEGGWSALPN
jgi:hypothetical protein